MVDSKSATVKRGAVWVGTGMGSRVLYRVVDNALKERIAPNKMGVRI